jgi:hypothetical protein
MKPNTNRQHKDSVWLIKEILSKQGQTVKFTKQKLLQILINHPETEEYLSYIKYTILARCRNEDIITRDSGDNLRFPIKRDRTGEVIEYHYIS